jgi:hypothetical protein
MTQERRKTAIVGDPDSRAVQLLYIPQLHRILFFGERDKRTILAMARFTLAAVAGNAKSFSHRRLIEAATRLLV